MTPRRLSAEQIYKEVVIAESMLERVRAAIAWFDNEDPRLPFFTQATQAIDELALEVRRLGVDHELWNATGFPYPPDGSVGHAPRLAGPSGREAKP